MNQDAAACRRLLALFPPQLESPQSAHTVEFEFCEHLCVSPPSLPPSPPCCVSRVVQIVWGTMEKPPFRQNQTCGDWELKERLGMGGFAHVYLYQHHVSLHPQTAHMWHHQWEEEAV